MIGKVKIAIIDNGINETFLKRPLAHKILVNNEGECVLDDTNINQEYFMHGTTCAIIIEKYLPESEISSIKILDESGTGLLEKLWPAMEWCLEHEIKIINLSLGTTHFKDKGIMKALVNHYSKQGLLIIAATANNGYVSYPASLANVIGVAVDSNEHYSFTDNGHLGIDVLVSITHELNINGEKVAVQKSNSYAAPYVTALIGKLSFGIDKVNIRKARRLLQNEAEKYGIYLIHEYHEPDWMDRVFIRTAHSGSCAKYFFSKAEEAVCEIEEQADTIVTDALSDLSGITLSDKNIVYLGRQIIAEQISDKFFWCPQHRLRQVLECTGNGCQLEFSIPIILFELEYGMDEMLLLSELKKSFYQEDYNIYTASTLVESVLYDLEYIPEEALKEENSSQLFRFLHEQTYYKQSDGLLIGIHRKHKRKLAQLGEKIDLQIKFKKWEQKYQVIFLYEGINKEIIEFEKIDLKAIGVIFQQMKEILEGNGSE